MFEAPRRPTAKQDKDEKKVPFAFFIILIVVAIIIVAFLIWLMFRNPSTESSGMEGPAALNVIPSASLELSDPFDTTPMPREQGVIIISTIEYNAGNIARISMILPEQLKNTELYIMDTPVDIVIESGIDQIAHVDLPPQLQAKEVELSFRSEGNQQAVCKISVEDISNPVGDCGW